MINILDHIPAGYHVAIEDGTISTDLASYFATAFSAGLAVYFPAGTYTLNTYSLPAGAAVLTDGPATRFKQLDTAAATDSILVVAVSDVTISDCTVEGIIDLFDYTKPSGSYPTGANNSEFNHGIAVRAESSATVRNIQIGNVHARDLRGDGISLFCATGAVLDGVRIGRLYGENVLRNGISVVGGRNIDIGDIDGTAFGYSSFDIEPEGSYSAPVENVSVRSIRGATANVAANPDTYARGVVIGRLDTDPAFATTSSPSYRNAAGVVQLDSRSGLKLRNADNVLVLYHRARGHAAHAIAYIPDASPSVVADPNFTVEYIDYAGIGVTETTYRTLINASGVRKVTVRGGRFTPASGQCLVLGSGSGMPTSCLIENVVGGGTVARYIAKGRFNGLNVDTNAAGTGFFLGIDRATISASNLRGGSLGYSLTQCIFEQTDFDQVSGGPYLLGGTSANNFARKSSVAGTFIEDGAVS